MQFRSILACLLLVLSGIPGFGQDKPNMSLPQLWEQAYKNNPGLDGYRSQQRQANINEKLIRNQSLPDVLLQGQNTFGTQNVIGGAFFPLPGLFNVNGTGINDSDYGANMFGSVIMDWKFMQFGKQKKSRETAELLTQQSTHRLNAEQLAIQAEVSRAYFAVQYYERMQTWAQINTERLQTIFNISASNVKAGLSPGADSLLIKASLDQTDAALHKWQGVAEEAKIALARWVNLPVNHFSFRNDTFLDGEIIHLINEDASNDVLHPQLAYKNTQIEYADKQRELASVSTLPSLSLLGGVQVRGHSPGDGSFHENLGNSYNNLVDNYLIGVGLTWNLGDVVDSRLEKRLYQEQAYQRQAEHKEVSLGLRSQSEIAKQQMVQGRQQIDNAEQAYAAAKQAYELFEARYNSGLISITELLQIQDLLQKTERTRIEAYYQYWMQQTSLAESTADFSYLQTVFE